LTLHPEIAQDELDAIIAVQDVANRLGMSILLVGAGARCIIFDWKYDLPRSRSTRDWDFAVLVDDWAHFEALVDALKSPAGGSFRRSSPHKLEHTATRVQVDLIPFGAISSPDDEIAWPSTGKVMSVLGLEEALHYAEHQDVRGRALKVATIPTLTALKLIAYSDRRELRDLEDVHHILANYSQYVDDDAVFDTITREDLEFVEAGAWVVGSAMAMCLTDRATDAAVDVLLALVSAGDKGPLVSLVPTNAPNWDAAFDDVVGLFRTLQAALERHRRAGSGPSNRS